ncbi:hypothetical protein KJ870_07540 [bacterium]|nr:hypothetical protein [bacterium]MBU1434773.1 hypothetical protein [bacterium]MBU1502761.1 hypothetical protein [bacterium]
MVYRFSSVLLCFVLFLNPSFLYAFSYDDDSLNIFAKIIPRFILMSESKNKIDKEITICLLYDSVEKNAADSLADKIKQNYPQGIKNYNIVTVLSEYTDFQTCQKAQLLFLFNTDENNLRRALDFSNIHKTLTVSYDAALLEFGVDMSLFLGRNIAPYINIKSILAKEIKLENVFLRISKIYKSGEK